MRYRRHRREAALPEPVARRPLSVFDPAWSELLEAPDRRRVQSPEALPEGDERPPQP